MKAKLLWGSYLYFTFLFTGYIFPENGFIGNIISGNTTDVSSVNPNVRILPGSINQVQTSVAVHPLNPSVMAAATITDVYPGGYTTGAYITTNNGANWTGTNSIRDHLGNIISTLGDPNIIIDKNGNYIITYTVYPLSGSDFKAGVSYSTNNGLFWSQTVYIPGVEKADKVTSAADNSSLSPYYGRIYAVYSDYTKSGLYFSTSSNGGVSWDTVKRISPPAIDARVGACMTVGKYGEIFVSWPYFNSSNSSSYIGFAKSTNGGLSWTANDTAVYVNLTRLAFRLFLNGCRANGLPVINTDKSGGPRDGTIYMTCTEKAASGSPATDDYDVIIRSSTNQGNNWSAPRKVNQDFTGSLKYQFFPVLTIDDFGGVNVVYYDTRNTLTNDSFEVFHSRSLDGGYTFQDYPVTDHKFKIKTINPTLFGVPGYIGSYIGVTSSKRTITPVWFDNATEIYQAWTSSIKIGIDIILIPQGFFNTTTDKLRMKDTIKVYLRNSASPYSIVDSSSGILDSVTFTAGFVFKNAVSGIYYLDIRHRNSINTWSKNTINYSTVNNTVYDFTTAATQAMGNNLTQLNNKYCVYGGDVNKDGHVDMIDINYIYNDQANFSEGYSQSDINGDSHVDLNDLSITFNNSVNFVSSVTP